MKNTNLFLEVTISFNLHLNVILICNHSNVQELNLLCLSMVISNLGYCFMGYFFYPPLIFLIGLD